MITLKTFIEKIKHNKRIQIIIPLITIVFAIFLILIPLGSKNKEGNLEVFPVETVKTFELISTVVHYSDVFVDTIRNKKIVYAYECPTTLSYDLSLAEISGNKITLPQCKIVSDRQILGEYYVGGDSHISPKESSAFQREIRTKINASIKDSLYSQGYVNQAYNIAYRLIDGFMKTCGVESVIIQPHEEDAKKMQQYVEKIDY